MKCHIYLLRINVHTHFPPQSEAMAPIRKNDDQMLLSPRYDLYR